MRRHVAAVTLLLAVALTACPRKIVVDPEVAEAKNARDWTVKAEPGKPPAKVPAAAPAAGAAGAATDAAKKP